MITVVVVNWNGWQETLEMYASLCSSVYKSWRLVTVDNASTDDSCERLEDLGPQATLIRQNRNVGFAGGCNVGIRAALEQGTDHIFLLNNDASVRPETLGALVEAQAQHPVAVLGALVRYKASGNIQFFGSRRSPLTGAPQWLDEKADAAELFAQYIQSDFVHGAALFAPSAVFTRVGLFDERFFLTYEETDWCYRALALGVPSLVVRDAIVDHAGSASMGNEMSPLQAYFLQRNRLLFYEKHAGARLYLRGLRTDLRSIRLGLFGDLVGVAQGKPMRPTRLARLIALRDYVIRQFGDSPDSVRRISRKSAVGQS